MTKPATAWRNDARLTRRHCAIFVVALLTGCQTPAPPMPAPTPPAPRLSYLNIEISLPLASMAAAADKEVPRTAGVEPFKHLIQGGANPPSCGIDAGYAIARGSLYMSGSGHTLTTEFNLGYWLQGRKQIPCPGEFMVASCGVGAERPRTAKVSIDTVVAVLPDFSTTVNSHVGSLIPGERCVLSPVGIDVTDDLVTAFQALLKPNLANMDKRLAAELQLRQRVETAWTRMGEAAELRPGIWLSLNPEGLGVAPVSIADGILHTGIQLRLRPVVTAGSAPESRPRPLPLADSVAAANTFELQIPVEVEQSFVQARLDKALDIDNGGMPVSIGNYRMRVTSADVSGQESQVVIKLTFKGDVNGTAFLTGTPHYDAEADTLSFPDLDYTVETDTFLLNSANLVAQGQIRERLRSRFVIEMARSVDNLKQSLQKVLNRSRGNMQLHGQVQSLDILGVYRLPNGKVFTAYLAAKGTLAAEIHAH